MDYFLISLIGLQFLSFLTSLLPLNFIPKINEAREIPLIYNSLVLSASPLGQFISSFVIVYLFKYCCKKKLLTNLLFCQLCCLLVFGLADYFPIKPANNIYVNILHIGSQFLNGFCCSSQSTILFTFVPLYYHNRMQEVFSYLDSGVVLGMTTGLSVGGALYIAFQNYAYIYFMITGIQFLFIFPFLKNIPSDIIKKESIFNQNDTCQIQVMKLFKDFQFLTVFIQLILVMTTFTILLNMISNLVQDQNQVTTILFTQNLMYVISATLTGNYFQKPKILMPLSGLIQGASFLLCYILSGPQLIQTFQLQLIISIIAGIGCSFGIQSAIVIFTEIGQKIFNQQNQQESIHENCSAILISVITSSEFFAPLLFGALQLTFQVDTYSFTICTVLVASSFLNLYIIWTYKEKVDQSDLQDFFFHDTRTKSQIQLLLDNMS